MDHPGRLALLARALPAIGLSRSAHSRWSREVGQASRQGIVGIIWRLFSAYLYLERRREPSRQLARPMEFSRTRITSRPTRALETSEKCARFKENERRAIEDPRQGKGVNFTERNYEWRMNGTSIISPRFSRIAEFTPMGGRYLTRRTRSFAG